ncbi:ROK family transcriptional regulator [Actinomyces bowdenii]|uniref:ROK family transcriptional regulator n=1 Tax=Actinomyces bowdenii TaxID=131109 RepID=A0A3P1V646_9ACTO|nr:ROK family transcriptional regulator [Actinomyces bowdenii]
MDPRGARPVLFGGSQGTAAPPCRSRSSAAAAGRRGAGPPAHEEGEAVPAGSSQGSPVAVPSASPTPVGTRGARPVPGRTRGLGSRALLALVAHGPMSRADLGERLGLSPPTTTRTVRPLLEAGLVEEHPARVRNGPGRPTMLLALAPASATFLGIKLTADRLYAVLTDPLGTVLAQDVLPLEDTDAASVVALIASAVTRLASQRPAPPEAIGISLGGSVVDRSTVNRAAFLGWREVPLAAGVEAATGIPCTVANDVRAFAYAEAWFGAGRDKDPFALVTLGAGIGCGIVVGGQVVSGARGAAGSVGHLPVAAEGPSCEMGHSGCARALASTHGICAALASALGREVGLEEALSPPLREDREVQGILRRAARAAGVLVGTLIAFVEPELTVVSGEAVGVVEAHREAFDEEVSRLRHWMSHPAPVRLRPFEFDEWARGAAALAVESWAESVGGR